MADLSAFNQISALAKRLASGATPLSTADVKAFSERGAVGVMEQHDVAPKRSPSSAASAFTTAAKVSRSSSVVSGC